MTRYETTRHDVRCQTDEMPQAGIAAVEEHISGLRVVAHCTALLGLEYARCSNASWALV